MASFGGHSVFANIYRDMRHPWEYNTGLRWIFSLMTFMDSAMAVIGYLMFGATIKDEVTTNILTTPGYHCWLDIIVLILVAIIPLTKFPLNCSPMVSTLEVFTSIDPRAAAIKPDRLNSSKPTTTILEVFFRSITVVVFVLLAIVVPSFELISAIMGRL